LEDIKEMFPRVLRVDENSSTKEKIMGINLYYLFNRESPRS
jgi:hypothetical protein